VDVIALGRRASGPTRARGAELTSALCVAWTSQADNLASELVAKLPKAALASLLTLSATNVASAAEFYAPPTEANTTTATAERSAPQSMNFSSSAPLTAPEVRSEYTLPEGNQWRYSDFVSAVENGKVERVRFSKDGSQLQLTAVDGRRAAVVLPNDPELVDILARNGVDISVSEGDQQGNYVALLGNILFPLIAFGGLFFLFRRSQNGGAGGPMGGMGGAMDFGRSKSKFQEVPETGVTFEDVAVSSFADVMPRSPHSAGCLRDSAWKVGSVDVRTRRSHCGNAVLFSAASPAHKKRRVCSTR
jgi:cell division protease FtsH